jgi:hypothetical protein
MNVEERLRDLLKDETEVWPHSDWRDARRRARRSRYVRAVVTAALVAGLVGGGVWLDSKLTNHASTFISPHPQRGDRVLALSNAGLRFDVPKGWMLKTVEDGRYYTVTAPARGNRPSPFEVGILFEQPRDFGDVFRFTQEVRVPRIKQDGVAVSERGPMPDVAGRNARQLRLVFPDSEAPATVQRGGIFDLTEEAGFHQLWCRDCVHTITFVDWPGTSVLLIRVNATAPNSADVDEVTRDILQRVAFVEPNRLVVPRGFVSKPILLRPDTKKLIGFLEMRAAGSGAESFIRNPRWRGGPELYNVYSRPMTGYRVVGEHDADPKALSSACAKAFCWTYDVTVYSDQGERDESITLTGDGTALWILDVRSKPS